MKRASLLVLFLLMLTACEPPVIHVTGISLNKTELSLLEGDGFTLYRYIEPADATDCSVIWSSSNQSVATVSEGIVTAVGPGAAVITVTTTDMGLKASCNVTVAKRIYEINNISFKENRLQLVPGDTASLELIVNPVNATYKDSIKILYFQVSSSSEFYSNTGFATDEGPYNDYVMTVDCSDLHDLKVIGRNQGRASINALVMDLSRDWPFTTNCTVDIFGYPQPDPVDLGLSVYWSSSNLCAFSESSYGPYFSWGDTTRKISHTLNDYPFVVRGDEWIGIPDEYVNIGNNISGSEQYDAARVVLGNGWRLPTKAEIQEFIEKCTGTRETINQNKGYRIMGPSGKSIFVPVGGDNGSINNYSVFWSSEVDTSVKDNSKAFMLFWSDSGGYLEKTERWRGYCIRPVKDK